MNNFVIVCERRLQWYTKLESEEPAARTGAVEYTMGSVVVPEETLCSIRKYAGRP